jgi:predicted nucleic acid-binding protein
MGTRLSFDGPSKSTRSSVSIPHRSFIISRTLPPTPISSDPVFSLLENHALRAVTSTVTFAEILTKPFADKNFSMADEIKFTLKSFSSLSVASIDEKLAEAAALIRARHAIRLPDALQIAAAIQGEATLVITNDKRLKKVDGVEVLVLSDFLQ